MRRLLTALVLLAATCQGASEGTIRATWSILLDGAPVSCATAGVAAVQVDACAAGDLCFHAGIQCAAGAADLIVPVDAYAVTLSAIDGTGARLATASAGTVDVGAGRTVLAPASLLLATPAGGMGSFHATWSLTRGGDPVSCAEVGAVHLEVRATSAETGLAYRDTFACADVEGTTAPVPLGAYTVALTLLDSAGAVLNNGPFPSLEETLATDRDLVELPLVIFTFDP